MPSPIFATPQGQHSETFTSPDLLSTGLTIPQAWDFHLIHSPNHAMFVYDDESGNPKRILWPQGVRAFHCAARLVQDRVGTIPDGASPVVAILALADAFTYSALTAGIIRAGYQAFPISIRNSAAGVAHLLSKTSCAHMFVSADGAMDHLSQAALAKLAETSENRVHVHPMPLFTDLYENNENVELLPSIVRPDVNAIALMLHSSGTTSFPKPIPLTHRIMVQWGMAPFYGEVDFCGHTLSVHSLPMFHAMGAIQLCWIAATGLTMSSFRPKVPPTIATSDSVIVSAVSTQSSMIFCVPAFLEAWSRDESLLPVLKAFNAIAFGGAPLQQQIGDVLISKGVPLFPFYGLTEAGCASATFPQNAVSEGWEYIRLSKHLDPIFVPQEDHENLYELVFADCPSHTPSIINTTVDGRRAYATNDLLIRHPTNPDLWKIFGRADDQIMHSTGEKTNPGPLEAILTQDSSIVGAVIFGRGRFQPGVILDLAPEYRFDPNDVQKLGRFRNDIWGIVEKANEFAPQHSRLFKEMILVSLPEKPFEYTPKGTPRRHVIINNYDKEIRAAYNAVDESSQTGIAPPTKWDIDGTSEFVRTVVHQVMQQTVADNDDIFQNGCDSLQATWIRNTILYGLRQTSRANTRALPSSFVYTYPTVETLSQYIFRITAPEPSSTGVSSAEKLREMEDMISKFTTSFPVHHPSMDSPTSETILLTGSTGGFGSYILEELLSLPTITRVYAFNRSPLSDISLHKRQEAGFKSRGIDLSFLNSEKLTLLEGDLTLPKFGLTEDVHEAMKASVTTIMHIAWKVNFNNALMSFLPNIQGLRNLIDFALSSPLPSPPRIEFTSSISVFRNWKESDFAPEIPIMNGSLVVGGGYGESKWVAERILQIAGERTPMRPLIVRVGQMCGGRNGVWNIKEWFPSMVKSGTVIKCLPDCQNVISWLPAHVGAKAFVEMRTSLSTFLHIVHPHPVRWSDIILPLASRLGASVVSYDAWLQKLEQNGKTGSTSAAQAAQTNPALRLIEFYRASGENKDNINREAMDFPSFETSETVKSSSTLGDPHLPPLGQRDIDAWLEYWAGQGFIPQ